MIRFYLSFFLLFQLTTLFAQQRDSSLLSFKQLGKEDITDIAQLKDQNVLSGSRTLKQVEDIPYTIYIITKEQIQEFGYITLADALKSVPGIRVSQPGSGLDGEMFLMRGLLGNQYTKILINDLPIRPTAARSMPIGAQLPIQQAERIEIIFGPTPSIYGADAMAGVINIITQKTERPFYVQSDVSLGTQDFKHLSVSLGGKLGKDKNVVSFNIFGSYTEMEDQPIIFDRDLLYNPSTYNFDQFYIPQFRNFIADTSNAAIIRSFPHTSESIGARVQFRSFRLDFEQMNRQDHSALGLHPVNSSLYNPLNFTGESITRFSGGWEKDLKQWSFSTFLTNIRYELNPRTSNNLILNPLNRGVLSLAEEELPETFNDTDFKKLATGIYNRYLSRQRYSYANSSDWYIDPLASFQLNEKINLTLGGNFLYSSNQAFINYLPIPFNDDLSRLRDVQSFGEQAFPAIPEEEKMINIGIYGQAYLKFNQISLLGILRVDKNNRTDFNDFARSSSLAVLYKLGEDLNARISWREAHQMPSSYYYANSTHLQISPDSAWFSPANPDLQRERNKAFEIGLRWGQSDNFQTDITYFRAVASPLLSFYNETIIGDPTSYFATYGTDTASLKLVRGFQGRLNLNLFKGTSGLFNFQFTRGKEQLPFGGGKIERIRGQGKWTWQGRLSTKINSRWFLQSIHTFSQEWVSRNLTDATDLREDNRYIIPKYYNLDVSLRYKLSREFQGFVQVFNVFNKEYGGISNTPFENNLIYNPQSLRTFRVGLNYKMR